MTQTQLAVGPVRPAPGHTALRPAIAAKITGGLWEERRRINREISIPGGWDRLHEAGNYHNLELAAGRTTGQYVNDLPFLDSDVYKWLEAVGWVFADPDLDQSLKERLLEHLAATERLLRRRSSQTAISTPTSRCTSRENGSSSCSGDTSSNAPDT